MNDKAQLHTLEGLSAAFMITMTVLAITQSTMIMTPQNELAVGVQLEQLSSDSLAVLDTARHGSVQHNLTECVASWNLAEATYPTNDLEKLDKALSYLLPGILYNVDLVYFDNDDLKVKKVIINGPPTDNAVVVRRFVTLTNESVSAMGGGWNLADDEIKVIEVRMTAWKV
ncbi:hypothetical protein [uncultured Methanolobus sp.]|uniref:DUF7288 family protein n=1 Tax=uncultured Methanolobus sp. TaxID=218300 RepID=UPI0029C7F152|nr:hypothetical protein [uncultured Methanolobus sp.]